MDDAPSFHELALLWEKSQAKAEKGEAEGLTLEQKKHLYVFQNLMRTVYFVDAPGTGVIKIGKTSDLEKRMTTLQTMCPVRLQLLMTIQYDDDLERRIHNHLADYRAHGEWFYACKPVKDFMRAYLDGGIQWLVDTVGPAPEFWLNRRGGLSYDMKYP